MKKVRYCYLFRIQYLGFRYSGWQKQPGQKTIEGMLTKTLKFVLPNKDFKILSTSRTDAKVSALDAAFELFLNDSPIADSQAFLSLFNTNLPPDIRILSMTEVDDSFNIIQHGKEKEYVYLFSYGEKNHPFCAPFMANIIDDLNIELMTEAAPIFMGMHNFKAYTARPRINSQLVRAITSCEIVENKVLEASFFPEKSYALIVTGQGFMRYQIRMIMGALIQLGRGELSISDIRESLTDSNKIAISFVAPGSGLQLNTLEFIRT